MVDVFAQLVAKGLFSTFFGSYYLFYFEDRDRTDRFTMLLIYLSASLALLVAVHFLGLAIAGTASVGLDITLSYCGISAFCLFWVVAAFGMMAREMSATGHSVFDAKWFYHGPFTTYCAFVAACLFFVGLSLYAPHSWLFFYQPVASLIGSLCTHLPCSLGVWIGLTFAVPAVFVLVDIRHHALYYLQAVQDKRWPLSDAYVAILNRFFKNISAKAVADLAVLFSKPGEEKNRVVLPNLSAHLLFQLAMTSTPQVVGRVIQSNEEFHNQAWQKDVIDCLISKDKQEIEQALSSILPRGHSKGGLYPINLDIKDLQDNPIGFYWADKTVDAYSKSKDRLNKPLQFMVVVDNDGIAEEEPKDWKTALEQVIVKLPQPTSEEEVASPDRDYLAKLKAKYTPKEAKKNIAKSLQEVGNSTAKSLSSQSGHSTATDNTAQPTNGSAEATSSSSIKCDEGFALLPALPPQAASEVCAGAASGNCADTDDNKTNAQFASLLMFNGSNQDISSRCEGNLHIDPFGTDGPENVDGDVYGPCVDANDENECDSEFKDCAEESDADAVRPMNGMV